jgi:hypothetical protein
MPTETGEGVSARGDQICRRTKQGDFSTAQKTSQSQALLTVCPGWGAAQYPLRLGATFGHGGSKSAETKEGYKMDRKIRCEGLEKPDAACSSISLL